MSSASSMRATCSLGDGQGSPTGTSLSASPEPMPRNMRPGNSRSSVAHACAIRPGWKRAPGGVTPVPSRIVLVAWPAAPSHGQVWPDSPPSHHGCR